ncbi:threonylcarbamoyl-AMP synthase [Thermococci archaeon]|nr:MAG: threonylcarbamoyl-AMP synthase [Thermococci archaeon]
MEGIALRVIERPKRNEIDEIARLISEGGVIVYPTDTVYGLGGNALSRDVVDRIYSIKRREKSKPVSIAMSKDMLSSYVEIGLRERILIDKYLPGKYTLILRKKRGVSLPEEVAPEGKVGVRVPDHPFVKSLFERIDFPIISTSANISGEKPPSTVEEAMSQLGDAVDLYVDWGKLPGTPSRVIDLTKGFEILR